MASFFKNIFLFILELFFGYYPKQKIAPIESSSQRSNRDGHRA